jgi:hypothetical protein
MAEAAAALAAVARGAGDTVPFAADPADAADAADGPASENAPVGHTAVLPVAPDPDDRPVPPDAAPDTARELAGEPPDRRRRRPALLVLGAAAVLAALVLVLVLVTREGPLTTLAPNPGGSSSATSSSTPATSPPRTTSRPTSTARTPTTTPKTTPSTSRPAPTRPSASTASSGPPTAAELAGAIRDYYAVLPGDTDAGWALLTPRYRTTTAGGRQTYERFWAAIDRVRASAVDASPPSSVVATLRYDYKDGRTYLERTDFTLVPEGGRLKIDRSFVLSSRQL